MSALDAVHDDVLIETIRRAFATQEPTLGVSRDSAAARMRTEETNLIRVARIAAQAAQMAVIKNVLKRAPLMHELAELVRRQDQRRKRAKRRQNKGGRPEAPHRTAIRSLPQNVLERGPEVVLLRLQNRGDIDIDGDKVLVLDDYGATITAVSREAFVSSLYEEKSKRKQASRGARLENNRK